jgi:hypothetical protein
MTQRLSEEELYKLAKARVDEKKGFFSHLASYCIVNAALFLLWRFATGAGYPWFLWPLAGWGIGLAFHFVGVFVLPTRRGGWEQREIAREMERLRNARDEK